MNEREYRDLCSACDELLLDPAATPERIANTWLHVIREHPVFLSGYADLFEYPNWVMQSARYLWREAKLSLAHAKQMVRAIRSTGQGWFGTESETGPIDVLFVSHAINEAHVNANGDFYFGGVPLSLAREGYQVVVALINHTRESCPELVSRWRDRVVPRLVLSRSLDLSAELGLLRRLREDARRLRAILPSRPYTLRQRVLRRASQEALSSGSLAALRIGEQIGALAQTFQPRALITTHEGHAWERVAFAAARRTNPRIICVGYQHAAIFRLQHAIRRRLSRGYDPDLILTAGRAGKAQLSAAGGLNGIPVDVLGSDRAFAIDPAVPGRVAQASETGGRRACLVLPEGLDSECRILFEFSLQCARQCPDIEFVWRLHPSMSADALIARLPGLRHLPRNVSFSPATLDEDIARCSWALYRGTTAIVKAVGQGLRPIYLQVSGEIPIDPLFDLVHWKASIGTMAGFQAVVTANPDPRAAELAIRHCATVFAPFDASVLERVLARP